MNKEKLLDDKTFIDLFAIENELLRTKKEVELSGIADELKCKKDFNKLLKAWRDSTKRKINVNNEIIAPNIPLEKLDGGRYTCNEKGIFLEGVPICFTLVIPTTIYTNIMTKTEKIGISYYKFGVWQEVILEKSILSIASRITQLSNKGLEITSENAKEMVKYFNEVININSETIKRESSVSTLGWQKKGKQSLFLPYDKSAKFDGVEDFATIYNSIKEKGNYNDWLDIINKCRKYNKTNQIIMAVSFASPLIEKMDMYPYIVNVFSSKSGTGKTVACMLSMSVWGDPSDGKLQFGTNNTMNFFTRTASFMKNITMFCDELQVIKHNRFLPLDSLVMELCNGKEKGRATKDNEIREVRQWRNNFLFTNNDKLAKANFGEQVFNRIIDVECNEQLIEHGNSTVAIIKENHGFAGKIFIDYIKNMSKKDLRERFNEAFKNIVENTKSTEKQAISLASIMVANELSQECIFKEEEKLTLDDYKDFINDREEIATWKNAYNCLLNLIDINKNKFYINGRDFNGSFEIWGQLETEDNYVIINKDILTRELSKNNFEFDAIKKEWAKTGIINKNSQGRYVLSTTVNGSKGTYVKINIL